MSSPNNLRKSASWVALGNLSCRFIEFGFSIALARILLPEHFGQVVTVQIFTGFASLLAGGGLGQALVRQHEITEDDRRTVFTIQLLTGFGFFGFFTAISPSFADFFKQDIYLSLMPLAAAIFIARPWVNIQGVLLQRNYQYHHITRIKIITLIASSIISLVLALVYRTPHSLIIGGLVSSLISFPLLTRCSHWMPKLGLKRSSINKLANFGATFTGNNLLFYFRNQIPRFLVGSLLGPSSLGLMNKADSLAETPLMVFVNALAQPNFRRMSELRDQPQAYQDLFIKVCSVLLLYIGPIYISLALLSKPFISLVFGENWAISGELLGILAWGGFIRLMINPASTVLSSKAKLLKDMRINIEIIILLGIYCAAFWQRDLNSLCYALVAASGYNLVRTQSYALPLVNLSLRTWLHQLSGVFVFLLGYLGLSLLLLKGMNMANMDVNTPTGFILCLVCSPLLALLLFFTLPSTAIAAERDRFLTAVKPAIKKYKNKLAIGCNMKG
ncbi:lipopolysaccharide biosynthesis protein [Motilimonas cestriensis]|uniref:Lipopolysaccharide biosynthesis protein n=1 Tax=Motilimonas cestriensis TaxID=2742685 RepID=A0ABS8W8T5_9GAMM|nr:lipopolysaccharide biosynthesis protein [Motilimonas cestriensis]MCE2594214.1 lipopolysaccharide biosynthesis protein [Motilimonas cestriensis]